MVIIYTNIICNEALRSTTVNKNNDKRTVYTDGSARNGFARKDSSFWINFEWLGVQGSILKIIHTVDYAKEIMETSFLINLIWNMKKIPSVKIISKLFLKREPISWQASTGFSVG